MNIPEIIERKRDGEENSPQELEALVCGVLKKSIPDYQISAWLMAVLFRGMTPRETATLTKLMMHSGEVLDLHELSGVKVDKHSTGGVGDKITIPLAPAAAACGAVIPMISGRALGHTGGTLDKLESIPGLRTNLEIDAFLRIVKDTGFAIAAAGSDLARADAKLYQLRDVTGTVPSIPLITASILSKKYAAGVEALVLDVKSGSGAFLREPEEARRLAETLTGVSREMGKKARAYITSMDQPLGEAVGNALEIRESMAVLEGSGPDDVTKLVEILGGALLELAGIEKNSDSARGKIRAAIESGQARERFLAWVAAQNGDVRALEKQDGLAQAPVVREARASKSGKIASIDVREIGYAANELGAGRGKMGDSIDPAVGFKMRARLSSAVRAGDVLAEIHARSEDAAAIAAQRVANAVRIEDDAGPAPPLVLEVLEG
ncbi:MAG TPA: thymidine phosphorylase [bacterium]|nr:thymidine phosphorylase [bacterium]